MDTIVWIVLAVVVVVLLAALAFALTTARTRKREGDIMRGNFGPEYDRAVRQYGSEAKAQVALKERQERVARFDLRPISAEDRSRFTKSWETTQAHFVDEPSGAIGDAQSLIDDAMKTRGFPVGDFDRQAEDISVDHPYVVENYRAAHDIAEKNAKGNADTEQLRQAMVHYRSLFNELINTTAVEPASEPAMPEEARTERADAQGVDMRRGATRN